MPPGFSSFPGTAGLDQNQINEDIALVEKAKNGNRKNYR